MHSTYFLFKALYWYKLGAESEFSEHRLRERSVHPILRERVAGTILRERVAGTILGERVAGTSRSSRCGHFWCVLFSRTTCNSGTGLCGVLSVRWLGRTHIGHGVKGMEFVFSLSRSDLRKGTIHIFASHLVRKRPLLGMFGVLSKGHDPSSRNLPSCLMPSNCRLGSARSSPAVMLSLFRYFI